MFILTLITIFLEANSFHYNEYEINNKVCKIYDLSCLPCKDGYSLNYDDLTENIDCNWFDWDKKKYGGCSVFGSCAINNCGRLKMDLICKEEKECNIDTDCPSDKACINNECIDPCFNCNGNNVDCKVINNTPICSCKQGFEGNPLISCFDKNECANPNDNNCNENAICTNLEGSFKCECGDGFSGDGIICTDNCLNGQVICQIGQTCQNGECIGEPSVCNNIICEKFPNDPCCQISFDPCSTIICSLDEKCIVEQNGLIETPKCISTSCDNVLCNSDETCILGECFCNNPGYTRKGLSGCVDVDECATFPNICGNTNCINTDGGYTCDGFCNGVACETINSVCSNEGVIFYFEDQIERGNCKCNDGFIPTLRDTNEPKFGPRLALFCEDINECENKPCNNGKRCVNTDGGFSCVCDNNLGNICDGPSYGGLTPGCCNPSNLGTPFCDYSDTFPEPTCNI